MANDIHQPTAFQAPFIISKLGPGFDSLAWTCLYGYDGSVENGMESEINIHYSIHPCYLYHLSAWYSFFFFFYFAPIVPHSCHYHLFKSPQHFFNVQFIRNASDYLFSCIHVTPSHIGCDGSIRYSYSMSKGLVHPKSNLMLIRLGRLANSLELLQLSGCSTRMGYTNALWLGEEP